MEQGGCAREGRGQAEEEPPVEAVDEPPADQDQHGEDDSLDGEEEGQVLDGAPELPDVEGEVLVVGRPHHVRREGARHDEVHVPPEVEPGKKACSNHGVTEGSCS